MNFLRGQYQIKESHITAYFVKHAPGEYFKISDRFMTGFPDAVYIYQGETWFIEFKRPGEKPTPAQRATGSRITNQGGNWICLSSYEEIDIFLNERFS